MINHSGVPVLGGSDEIKALADYDVCLCLVLISDIRMAAHVERYTQSRLPSWVRPAVAVIDVHTAHLIPANRVPQLVLMRKGKVTRRVHLTLDPTGIEEAISQATTDNH